MIYFSFYPSIYFHHIKESKTNVAALLVLTTKSIWLCITKSFLYWKAYCLNVSYWEISKWALLVQHDIIHLCKHSQKSLCMLTFTHFINNLLPSLQWAFWVLSSHWYWNVVFCSSLNFNIFQNEIAIKLRMTGSHMVLNGVLKDLQLFSCCYNPAKRKDTKAQVSILF